MQKEAKKGKGSTGSSQPLIAGLSFFMNQYAKEKTQKLNKNKTIQSTTLSNDEKSKVLKEKDDSKPIPNQKFKKSEHSSNGKAKKPHFWWLQYDPATYTKMLITPEKPWYEQYPNLLLKYSPPSKEGASREGKGEENKSEGTKYLEIKDEEFQSVQTILGNIYQKEIDLYQKELMKLGVATDAKWLNSVISSGTWSDKIAALTLRIQESPFHNLETLDLLLGIAEKKDQRVSFFALQAMKDLFIHNLLPDGKSLHFFTYYRPIITSSALKLENGLLIWFEDQLKQRMEKMLTILEGENGLKANIVYFRKQGLEILSDLLIHKPEQEHRILILIVNKLGDHEGSINTKAMDVIKHVLKVHPVMKLVIIKEIKNFIYHPANKLISIYHAIILLLRFQITNKDSHEIPLELAECYISLFDKALQAKAEGSRLLSALLQGINQTFHLLNEDISRLNKYLDVIFRLVHTAPSAAASTQALVLLSYMAFASIEKKQPMIANPPATTERETSGETVQNRFYTALYTKLLSDQVLISLRNTLFLNLLYRSMKIDPNVLRIAAFVKRILMVTAYAQSEVTAGLLFIISEVVTHRPELKPLLTYTENRQVSQQQRFHSSKGDEDEAHHSSFKSSNLDEALNVLENYDPNKRNPAYACLNNSFPILYEQEFLKNHYHPSVQAFANALFTPPHHRIEYSGDPLTEFSIMAFLNRFAYKNPKQRVIDELKTNQKIRKEEQPVNQEFKQFMKLSDGKFDLSKIAPDKQFFYKYFYDRELLRAQGRVKQSRNSKNGVADDDGEEEEDEEVDEDEVDAFADQLAEDMMKQDAISRGEALGDDDDDDDMEDYDDDALGLRGGFDDDDDDADVFDPEEEEAEEKTSKGKKNKKNKKKRKFEQEDDDDNNDEDNNSSSAAIDFEDFMKEKQSDTTKHAKKEPKTKKNKKNKKKQNRDGYDSDDIPEPEIYHDDIDVPAEEVKEQKIGSSKKQNKKQKRRSFDDDIDYMDVEGGDGDDAFADADLYEDQMERNVKQYEFNVPKSSIRNNDNGSTSRSLKNQG